MDRRVLRACLVVYGALLAVPVPTLVGETTVLSVAVAAAVGATVVGFLTATRDPVTLVGGWRSVLVGILPGVWLVPLVSALPPTDSIPWLQLAGIGAVLPGLLAIGLAHHRRTQQRLAAVKTHCTFSARLAPRVRRQLQLAVAVLLALTVLFAVGMVTLEDGTIDGTAFVWLPGLLPVWLALLFDTEGREVAITEAGLQLQSTIHEWETIAGYEVTEQALRITRTGRLRSTFAFDRADIDDLEGVTAALSEYAQRRD